MGRLDGKVAIVTGAGQGVGEGCALALAAEGAAVVAAGRTREKVEATAARIAAAGGRALAVGCDVTRRSDVDGCVAAALERFGRLDALVNNAQTVALGPVLDVTEDDVRRTFDSGYLGTLWFMQAAFPALRETGGSVVNLGTGAALRPDPAGFAVYAGVKEMVRTLTRAAAVEWGSLGVRVNAVIPNAASPGMRAWSRFAPDSYAEFVATIPLGRLGDCEADVGRVVAFLVSEDAAYVTGSTLMVDGGQAYLR